MGHIVVQEEGQDCLFRQFGHTGGRQIIVLLIRHNNVVRDRVKVIFCLRPCGQNRIVDIRQNLIRRLILKLCRGGGRAVGCRVGDQDIRIIQQPRTVINLKANIGILIHMFVVGHAQAVPQQAVQVTAGHVAALHINPLHAGSGGNHMGLKQPLRKVRLYHRDAVGCTGSNKIISGASGNSISYLHGGDKFGPSATHPDGDVPCVCKTGKGCPHHHVPLFQLGR